MREMRAINTIPPTTPPTMAPIGVFFFLCDPIVEVEEDDEGVFCGVD